MGWGSATGLFDGAVDVVLEYLPKPVDNETTYDVVKSMYTQIDWGDWDTQDESKYFEQHLIHVMNDLGEIDANHYEWYTKGQPDEWDWTNKGW